MSRVKWGRIKKGKFFYVNTYRRIVTVIIFSQLFNLGTCLLLAYLYLHKPAQHFYATNGEEPATELFPSNSSIYIPNALLDSEPGEEQVVKRVPD